VKKWRHVDKINWELLVLPASRQHELPIIDETTYSLKAAFAAAFVLAAANWSHQTALPHPARRR
jgi:hypothetical protein